MPTSVLRVGKEIDNIGERVAMSKKRISWHFVFTNDQEVHTVTLEHSRLSAKKRLKLDGKKLYQSDTYCKNGWKYHFHLPNKNTIDFCVEIKEVKKIMSMKISSSSSQHQDQNHLDHDVYELSVNGIPWCELDERKFSYGQPSTHNSHHQYPNFNSTTTNIKSEVVSVWSSEMYARKIEKTYSYDQNERKKLTSWVFTFGLHGVIHRLDLQIQAQGYTQEQEEALVVVLDGRILTSVLKSSLSKEKIWHFQTNELLQHQVEILLQISSPTKEEPEFFIDGFRWHEMSETDFVLLPGWYPVFSRTRGTNYYRNDALSLTQWEKPIMKRGESLSPMDPEPEEDPSDIVSPAKEATLLDFSMWEHPTSSTTSTTTTTTSVIAVPVKKNVSSFDPFAPVSCQPKLQQPLEKEDHDELKPKDFCI